MNEKSQADRRVQRTRRLLQDALITLIAEKGYDAVTVQDITERANLGRTTFYTHYRSKEDLFLSCHEYLGTLSAVFVSEDLLSSEPLPRLVAFLETLRQNRRMYYFITQSSNAGEIMRGIRAQIVGSIQVNLRKLSHEEACSIPLDVLANYLAGSQIALITWWIENRAPYSSQEIARMLNQMQTAVIREALGVPDVESGTRES
jgi:AcrR family transcriptional regulator